MKNSHSRTKGLSDEEEGSDMDAKVGDLRFSGDLIDSFSSKKKSSYTKLKPSLGDAERPQSSESCVIDLRQVERARREGRSRRSKKAKKEKGSVVRGFDAPAQHWNFRSFRELT